MIKKVYKYLIPEKTRIEIRFFLYKLVSPVYSGNNFFCNCCGKHFRKFLSKGNIKRTNAQCPYCESLERTRLLHLYLINETRIFNKHCKVLHIAPERCLKKLLIRQDIEYIDGDIHPAYARNVIDITDISFPDNYFDLIICSHVLGHIPDEAKAIRELKRVLKAGGIALILTLINHESEITIEDEMIKTVEERLFYYGETDLCRLHGLDFSSRLEQQGFQVECIDYRNNLPSGIVKKNCLGDGNRELIFRCTI